MCLSCGLFDRVSAEQRGVYVVDDSDGLGAKTWELPTSWPPYIPDAPPEIVAGPPSTPAPVPPPSQPTPVLAPIPSPVTAPPVAVSETISGAQLADFMRVSINSLRGQSTFGDSSLQLKQYVLNQNGTYSFGLAAISNNSGRSFDGLTIEAPLANFGEAQDMGFVLGKTLRAHGAPETTEYIFPTVILPETWYRNIPPSAPVFTAENELIVRGGDRLELDKSLQTWRSGASFVQFQIGSVSATKFRVCWHVNLPSVIRVACYLWPKDGGEGGGIHVVDDSDGLGQRTYHQEY